MPGMVCSVASCRSNSKKAREVGEKLTFFTFPKNEDIRVEWVKRCNRSDDFNPSNKRICSKHFLPEDFEDRIKASIMNEQPKKLKECAIPTLNLEEKETPDETPCKPKTPKDTLICSNRKQTKINKVKLEGDFESIYVPGSPEEEEEETNYEKLQRKYNELLEENKLLKELLKKESEKVRKKGPVNVGAEVALKKRKIIAKPFDLKHFSELYNYCDNES